MKRGTHTQRIAILTVLLWLVAASAWAAPPSSRPGFFGWLRAAVAGNSTRTGRVSRPVRRSSPTAPVAEPMAWVRVERLHAAPVKRAVSPDTFGGGYHGTTVTPAEVLRVGLQARGTNWNLTDHVLNPLTGTSAFRGTTMMPSSPDGRSGAALWAGVGHYVYEIRGVPTWDVNRALEATRVLPDGVHVGNPVHGELEYAIPGAIAVENIRRWGKVTETQRGVAIVREWFDNPRYRDTNRH